MSGITVPPVAGNFVSQQPGRRPGGAPLPGQVITAVVTQLSQGQFTLETREGFRFTAEASSLEATVGDEIRFEVLDMHSSGTIQLRRLPEDSHLGRRTTQAMQVASLREIMRSGGLYSDARSTQSEDKEHLDKLRAIAAIRRQVAAGRSLAPQVVAQLAAFGLSLDKMGFDTLAGIMNDIGVRHACRLSDAEAQEAVALYTKQNDAHFSRQEGLLQSLARYGVPLTEENITSANHALDTFAAAADITDTAKAHLLREGQPLSVGNIYAASFSSGGRVLEHSAEISSLAANIEDFFTHMNIPNTPENHELALFMIMHDLDITSQSLDRLALLDTIASPNAQEEVAERLAYAMSLGRNPLSAELDAPMPAPNSELIMGRYQDLLENFPDVSHIPDDTLGTALAITNGSQTYTTIANLRQITHAYNIGAYAFLAKLPPMPAGEASREYLARMRITLEQIRIKLSFESARLLSAKGIDINTMPLFEALESVKAAQQEVLATTASLPPIHGGHAYAASHATNIQTGGNSQARPGLTPTNIDLLIRTSDTLQQIHPIGPITLGGLMLRRYGGASPTFITSAGLPASAPEGAPEPTISSIAAAARRERLEAGYEQFATTINPSLGDSFSKIRNQFTPLLLGLGIRASAPNINAAQILTRNNIDITEMSVAALKQLEHEVSFVAERLHPVIANSIIREGLNPLDMHLDEIIQYINRFNDTYGVSDTDRIAAYIAQMDKERILSPNERERLVAFYRVLNQVSKDGSAALGIMYKNDSPLTLGNMLTASAFYQGTKNGKSSSFVSLNTDSPSELGVGRIRAALEVAEPAASMEAGTLSRSEDASSNPPQATLDSLLASKLSRRLPPGELSAFLNNPATQESQNLEEMMEHFSTPPEEQEVASGEFSAQTRFAEIFNTPAKAIHWLSSRGLEPTPTLMAGASALLADQFFIGREFDKLRKRLAQEHPETTLYSLEDNSAARLEALRTFVEELDADNISTYSSEAAEEAVRPFAELAHLYGSLRIKNASSSLQGGSDYSFPVKLNGRIGSLNMFVVNPAGAYRAEETRAIIALATSGLGDVSTQVTLDGEDLSLHVGASSPEGLAKLKARASQLSEAVAEAGFNLTHLTFAEEAAPPFHALDNDMNPRPIKI